MRSAIAIVCLGLACGVFTLKAEAEVLHDAVAEVAVEPYTAIAEKLTQALATRDRVERLRLTQDVLSQVGYDFTFGIPDEIRRPISETASGAGAEPQILPLAIITNAPAVPRSKTFLADMSDAQTGPARIIVLSHGTYTLTQLAQALARQGDGHLIAIDAERASINLPIYVGPGAELTISSDDARLVTLSATLGAFIIAAGNLVLQDTQVSGDGLLGRQRPDDDSHFDPFLLIGDGGTFHASNTGFARLGNQQHQSFGVGLLNASPKSTVVANRFNDTYGLRIEDSSGVDIGENEFGNPFGPAIHVLHSRKTEIHGNLIYGAASSPGILLGRDTGDARVSGNILLLNKSGIAVALDSGGNIIEKNAVVGSGGAGISLAGQHCNLISENHLLANRTEGIAWRGGPADLVGNLIAFNRTAGITSSRQGEPRAIASGELYLKSNQFLRNRVGLRIDMADGITFENNSFRHQSPRLISGALGSKAGIIMDARMERIHFVADGQRAFRPLDQTGGPQQKDGCTAATSNPEVN